MEPVWFRFEALTTQAEASIAKVWQAGAAGVEIQDHATFMEGGAIPPVGEGQTRVIAFFESESGQMDAPDISGLECLSWSRYDDRSWETAWKAYFKPVLLSPSIRVGPPWEDFEAPDGGHKLIIEPGMAFGTGTHETTQLCASELENLLPQRAGARVLDVGCGSAILSICARFLGSGPVDAIDITDDVVDNAKLNIKLNGVDNITLAIRPIEDVSAVYEVVVANILGHILRGLREELVRHLAPGGVLLMSGLTTEQEVDFCEYFDVDEISLISRTQAGDWVCLVYERQ